MLRIDGLRQAPSTEQRNELLLDVLNRFADLEAEEIRPTCSCILAIDLGIPTKIAHLLLEQYVSRGTMLRTDLKDAAIHRQDLRQRLSDKEAEAISEFPASLDVYFSRRHAARTDEFFPPLVIQLSLMFRILEQVLFYDKMRLKWDFQAATKALRQHEEWGASSYPVGQFAAEHLGEIGCDWAQAHSTGGVRFEEFEANASTQLRMLMFLALQVAGGDYENPRPWSLDRLTWSSRSRRADVVGRLGRLVIEGLEVPRNHRSKYSRRVLPDIPLGPEDKSLWQATDIWYTFLANRKNNLESEVWEKSVTMTLNRLPPRNRDALPQPIAAEVSDEKLRRSQRDRLLYSRN